MAKSELRFHKKSNKLAMRILSSIESEKGRIPRSLIRKSTEYASEVLGWRGFAPWLYVYSAFSGNFRQGWIPDNYYAKVVVPAVTGDYWNLSFRRGLTNKIFNDESFPDLIYYTNGTFYSKYYEVVKKDCVKKILFSNADRVMFKLENSQQGRGIYCFGFLNFDIHKIQALGNGVFQKFIDQHELFERITPNSVATIRMTTVFESSGHVSLRAVYLRLGSSADGHVKYATQVRLPINKQTGEFGNLAYTTEWKSKERHPDTQFIFAGNAIPNFEECRDIVIRLHKKIPQVMCVGWDLAVDKNNKAHALEWNSGHNVICISEAADGPCFLGLGWESIWKIY